MPVEVGASGSDAGARESKASAAILIQRVARGDCEALGELFDLHSGLVGAIAERILRDHADAQDVVQTVFLQVWHQAGRYDSARGPASAWLSTIARTRALDCLRMRKSRREESGELAPKSTPAAPIVERLTVRRALAGLPAGQQLPLKLAYYEGLTQTEIAQRVGAPLGTIKSRLRTGLIQLRARLRAAPAPGGCPPASVVSVGAAQTERATPHPASGSSASPRSPLVPSRA
jgi:RNA polymerase sigma-70 factor, ECF subfamily